MIFRSSAFTSVVVAVAAAATLCLTVPSAEAADKDACSLITAADAEAALGEAVGPPRPEPRPSPQGDGTACRFRGAKNRLASISLTVQNSTQDLRGTMGGMAENLKSAGYHVEPVAGIGDEAIWATHTAMGRLSGELTIRKGKSTLLILLINGGQSSVDALKRLRPLVAKIVPKA